MELVQTAAVNGWYNGGTAPQDVGNLLELANIPVTRQEGANTNLVALSYPSPILKNGITIIDTPGIGGLDPRHAILTHMALPKADVIVFVTDAGEPLTQSELEFYENKVLSCGKQNIVLVNKSDILTAETLAAHVNNTKLQLAKLGSPEVIPVSAKCWELYSRLEDKDFLSSSNKDAVLAGITSEVAFQGIEKEMYDPLGYFPENKV